MSTRCAPARIGLRVLVVLAVLTLALVGAESAADAARAKTHKVRTDKGVVRGKITRQAREYLGIPYARPPVGRRRWRAPAPARRFRRVLNATHLRSPCLQDNTEVTDRRLGSENCLYLNVYSPRRLPRRKLPVMVWFHGGAFITGSGNIYDGRKLTNTSKAIIVTVNYRLGPFGWLALPGLALERRDGSTGNYGLMDQQAALRWVRRNIRRFGGNRRRVTVFGQSAGGEAGFAHLISPRSRGLFSRVISQSGPVALRFPTKDQAYQKYEPVAVRAGCRRGPDQVSCLRKASGRKILRAADESWDLVRRLGLDWTPTTDGAVLPRAFQDALAAGEFARVPVMVGGTANEGRLFVAIFENNNGHALTEAEEFERLDSFFQKLSGFPPAVTRPTSQGTIDRYRAYGSPGLSFGGIITDSFVACSGSTMRDRLAAHVPTYGYEFNDPNAGRVEIKARFIRLGAAHDSELPYLFQVNPDTQRTPKFTRRQKRLAKQIGRYWGRFARTGNPNGRGLQPWARWDAMREPIQSLRPGGTRTLPQGAFTSEHQCDYWDPLLSAVG